MRNPAKDWRTEKLAGELVDSAFKRQVSVPIIYEGVTLDTGLRLDVVVADCIVVEIKAVDKLITFVRRTGSHLPQADWAGIGSSDEFQCLIDQARH